MYAIHIHVFIMPELACCEERPSISAAKNTESVKLVLVALHPQRGHASAEGGVQNMFLLHLIMNLG
jgi:hypothetical protein